MIVSRRRFLGLSATLAATTTLSACSLFSEKKTADLRLYECQNSECEPFIYDPKHGVEALGIPPGIPFTELPDDWVCPICGDSKRQFKPLLA